MNQAEMMEEQGYLAAPVAARRAGVTVYTIYRWITAGKVVGTKVAGRRYVLKDSLADKLGPVGAAAAGLISTEPAPGSEGTDAVEVA